MTHNDYLFDDLEIGLKHSIERQVTLEDLQDFIRLTGDAVVDRCRAEK